MKKYTLCVDFDGVLHSYTSIWVNAHTIPDDPTPGAIEWLHRMIQIFDIAILSTRTKGYRGRRAIRAWLKKHSGNLYWPSPDGFRGIEDVRLVSSKPPALIYLDDRAVRFTGENWPSRKDIHGRYRPWHRKKESA